MVMLEYDDAATLPSWHAHFVHGGLAQNVSLASANLSPRVRIHEMAEEHWKKLPVAGMTFDNL